MTQNISRGNDILKAIRKVVKTVNDPSFVTSVLAEPDGIAIASEIMNEVTDLWTAFDNSASNPALDDFLGRGNGPLSRLASSTALAYGAKKAMLMPHGSSHGNIGVALAFRAWLGRTPRFMLDRATHVSPAGGLSLAKAEVVWLLRGYDEEHGVQLPITAASVARSLDESGPVDAVWITIPTYDGILPADIAAIAAECHKRGVKLIVDSAWGAFLGLLQNEGFPASPASVADVTVISLHKHGLGLSGASCALFNDLDLAEEFGRVCDLGLLSTSPPFFAAMVQERALEYWSSAMGKSRARTLLASAAKFQAALDQLPGLSKISAEDLGPGFVSDPSHQLFNVKDSGLTGFEILNRLASEYEIDIEKATPTTILFLFGPEQIATWPKIVNAVEAIIKTPREGANISLPQPPINLPVARYTMGEAFFMPKRRVSIQEAVGQIAAQTIAAYPPGSAIFQPGEIITQEAIDYLLAVERSGSRLKGVNGSLREVGILIIDNRNNREI